MKRDLLAVKEQTDTPDEQEKVIGGQALRLERKIGMEVVRQSGGNLQICSSGIHPRAAS